MPVQRTAFVEIKETWVDDSVDDQMRQTTARRSVIDRSVRSDRTEHCGVPRPNDALDRDDRVLAASHCDQRRRTALTRRGTHPRGIPTSTVGKARANRFEAIRHGEFSEAVQIERLRESGQVVRHTGDQLRGGCLVVTRPGSNSEHLDCLLEGRPEVQMLPAGQHEALLEFVGEALALQRVGKAHHSTVDIPTAVVERVHAGGIERHTHNPRHATVPTMSEVITPFRIDVPESELTDLRTRLQHARLPEAETVSDWSQGIPLAYVRELVDYWRTAYDWRRAERLLNGFPQFRTDLSGPDGKPLNIHFLHVRSPEPHALPLVMTHGWPGSILEFHKVIGPLTDPRAHGGDPGDAFHVVAPALPGYGFSAKPTTTGWGVQHIASAWGQLMRRLGYERYGAQGGDWGAITTTWIGRVDTAGCLGLHINMPIALPAAEDMDNLTPRELEGLAAMQFYNDHDSGYSKQQSTRPQTLGYGLVDSPVGQMAWIVEKFFQWTDCDGHPENVLTRDELLDNVMLYWLTASGASSARLYWESFASSLSPEPVTVPSGMSIFPKEIFRPSRRWAERTYTDIRYWNELERGGHFAAFEQPERFVDEVRKFFRTVR